MNTNLDEELVCSGRTIRLSQPQIAASFFGHLISHFHSCLFVFIRGCLSHGRKILLAPLARWKTFFARNETRNEREP